MQRTSADVAPRHVEILQPDSTAVKVMETLELAAKRNSFYHDPRSEGSLRTHYSEMDPSFDSDTFFEVNCPQAGFVDLPAPDDEFKLRCQKKCLQSHRGRQSSKSEHDDILLWEWKFILEAYNYCCAYCWQRPFAKFSNGVGSCPPLELEHIIPLSRGGDNCPDNVVPSCSSCNAKKGTKLLSRWLSKGQIAAFDAWHSEVMYALMLAQQHGMTSWQQYVEDQNEVIAWINTRGERVGGR